MKGEIVWTGWIVGPMKLADSLREMGVILELEDGSDPAVGEWLATVPDSAMEKLNPFWGDFVWGLERAEPCEI